MTPRVPAVLAAATFGLLALLDAAMAQAPAAPSGPPRIEPGLEEAVKWKWWVSPSLKISWGLPLPQTGEDASGPAKTDGPAGPRPTTYEVQSGDALVKIGRRFGMTADQLKTFNGLTSDTIQIGQILKIPTLVELTMMVPPPSQPLSEKKGTAPPVPTPAPSGPLLSSEAKSEMETVLLQVFMDREQFSTGAIDGRAGPTFKKVRELFVSVHPELVEFEALREKAKSVVGNAYTTYHVKPEDFRFITPPKEPALGTGLRRRSKSRSVPQEPPPTYEELVAAPMLAYQTPWEFVAERFHCEEAFLRKLNSKITGLVSVGTEFLVPNVKPFEIETSLDALQPQADPQNPITAAVVELNRVEVYRAEKLIAVMPMTLARPDLRGRGSWTVLDAVPRPRLATLQEVKVAPKKKPTYSFSTSTPEPEPPPPAPALSSEQYLPAGPNNPVGVIWINLAKSNSTEPLPYGLHGTSIPERMKTQESIGGLRLTNWDIVRAAQLLPPGTPLKWK